MKKNPLEWLSEALLTITAIPVLIMMINVTLDVVLKYTINFAIQGTLEVTAYYYMVSIVLLPLGFVELTRQSIAVDLFYQMFPRKVQIAVMFFVLIVCALGYGGLGYISWFDALEAFEKKQIAMGSVNIYVWPTRFLMPFGMGITTLVCLMHAYRLVTNPAEREKLIAIHIEDAEAEAI